MQGNLRIVRVWDQTGWGAMHGGDGVSVPYGAVYATPSEMLERQCSSSSESHGTHVAGIAAGSGGEMGLYKGVAPDAELVLVHLHNGSQSELIEGLDYIFRYANQAGKPAVANLSLGTHYGPHDGTSQFDRALDGLVGNGRIAVGAAGNEGGSKLHASHTFNKSGSVVRTVVGVTERKSSVIAFAPTNRQLQWTVEVWDVNKNTRLHQATGDNFCSTQSGSRLNNKRFIATATDTVTVSGMGYNNYDGSNRGVVEIDATNNQPSKYAVVLVLKMAGDELGTVHLWNLGNEDEGAPFGLLKNSTYTWIDGNDSYTVGEIGGISKNIISVGSYNSRRNGDEAVGAVSYFSSKGPTVDGRVKPDIIAPGYSLFSAVNSCTFPPALLFRNIYEEMSGTSMATPMVTGAVALLLQKSPTLTPDNVRCLLQQNASTDQIEHLSQNTRGAGKLDIQRAMENGNTSVCTPLSAQHSRWSDSQQAIEFKIIPNPNNGTFVLETEEEAKLTFSVYNMVGALLYSSTVQADGNVELNFLPHGLYVVQLSSEKKTGTKKMLVYR
jgi:subtilisin family serine protease